MEHSLISKISEGRPEAQKILTSLIENDFNSYLKYLELLSIRGKNLEKLWQHCCDKNLSKFVVTIRMLSGGWFENKEILDNLNSPSPIPFIASNEMYFEDIEKWEHYCTRQKEKFNQIMEKENYRKIFFELVKEMSKGQVILETEFYSFISKKQPIKMFTQFEYKGRKYNNIKDDNTPILKITNFDRFFDLLVELVKEKSEYLVNNIIGLTDKGYQKAMMYSIFLHMTEKDFENPYNYLKDSLAELKETWFDNWRIQVMGKVEIEGQKYDLTLENYSTSFEYEAVNAFCFYLRNSETHYHHRYSFPTIFASLVNDRIIVRAIQRKNNNIDCEMDNEIEAYIKNNIPKAQDSKILRNVTPSFVLALSIFLNSVIKDRNGKIKYIEFPMFCPIPYDTKVEVLKKKERVNSKSNIEKLEKIFKEADRIQSSKTNKLIYTALRLQSHCKEFEIFDYGDIDSYLKFKYNPSKKKANHFFDQFNIYENNRDRG